MTVSALAETADFYRIDATPNLDARKRALLGRYMTPMSIGPFMASLFSQTRGEMRVLIQGRVWARSPRGQPSGCALRPPYEPGQV